MCTEEEPEREGALPWEFSNTALQEFQEEVKGLVLKLSQVRTGVNACA